VSEELVPVDASIYMDIVDLNDRLMFVDMSSREIHKGNWVKPVKINDVMYWRRDEIEAWIKLTTQR
jgi:predicted DNA-binding transcriptional regulator AlpA